MKTRNGMAGAALLALLASATLTFAADKKPGAKPDKPGDKKEMKAPKPDKRTIERLEKMNGKPLTDDQMKAVETAWAKREAARKAMDDQFKTDAATALGMTAEQWAAKEKELRSNAAKDGAKPATGGAPATKPATP